jgi:hypothetical protein
MKHQTCPQNVISILLSAPEYPVSLTHVLPGAPSSYLAGAARPLRGRCSAKIYALMLSVTQSLTHFIN